LKREARAPQQNVDFVHERSLIVALAVYALAVYA
jgi:hypothetical protein